MCTNLLIVVMFSLLVAASATEVHSDDKNEHLIQQRKVVKIEKACPLSKIQEYCTVEVQAYSGYDSPCHGANEGFVKLNGNTIWSAGWCSELRNSRGVTIITVDTHLCTASAIRRFDTHESESNAVALATYLQMLPFGAVVVGVTGDEPAANLGPALETLKSMKVDVGEAQNRGNFAFVLQKGYSFQPVVEKGLATGDEPAKIIVQLEDECRILVQQHGAGTPYFNRTWAEYKVGFGDVTSNYWIGNDRLYNLTWDGNYKLRAELLAKYDSQWYWAEYETFRVLDESTGYVLWIGGYNGTAGNSLSYANGIRFSTKDSDFDTWCSASCAQEKSYGNNAGFWYTSCSNAYINSPSEGNGFTWWTLPTGSNTAENKRLIMSRLYSVLK